MANKVKVNVISFNVHINYTDESGAEPKPCVFNDSVTLNFNDEAELNRTLKEKEIYAELIPKLVKKAIETHDPENKAAKKLFKDLGI